MASASVYPVTVQATVEYGSGEFALSLNTVWKDIQRDPNTPGNGRDSLIEHFRRVPIVGSTPPPVVSVILDGEVACVMMRELAPDPVVPGAKYEWNILTVFRVHDGMLAEHWSTFRKVAPGQNPMGE